MIGYSKENFPLADFSPVPLTLEGSFLLHQFFRFDWSAWRRTPPTERDRYLLYKNHRVIMTGERVLHEIERAKLAPAKESLLDCLAEPAAI